jgi:hypothetical protein
MLDVHHTLLNGEFQVTPPDCPEYVQDNQQIHDNKRPGNFFPEGDFPDENYFTGHTSSASSGCSAVTFDVNQKIRSVATVMINHTAKIPVTEIGVG